MVFRRRALSRKNAARKIGRFVKRGWNMYKRNRGTIGRLARDVAIMKSLVNAEKKYVSFIESFNFGQSYNAAGVSGHFVQSLISLAQGSTASTRTGNSIKPTSLQYVFRVRPQTNTVSAVQYGIYILLHKNNLVDDNYTTGTTGTIASQFLDTDYSTNLYTNRSLRIPERFKEWVVLKYIKGYMKPDSSSTGGSDDYSHKGVIKLWNHMKFNGSNTPCIENQLYYLFVAGSGDCGTAATGLAVNSLYRLHYLDN